MKILEIIDRKRCSRREAIQEIKDRAHGYAGVSARSGAPLDSTMSKTIITAMEATMTKMVDRIVTIVTECISNVLAANNTQTVQPAMVSSTAPGHSLSVQHSLAAMSCSQNESLSALPMLNSNKSDEAHDADMDETDTRILKRSGSPLSNPSSPRPQAKSKKQQLGSKPKENILGQAVAAARIT